MKVNGTNNVAWFCRKTGGPPGFPFSMAVIGDPQELPITVDHSQDPLNWYGRTKVLGEQSIGEFAEGAFPIHQFMIPNLYGSHEIDGRGVSKETVINFFVNRALDGEPLTVYEPGTQARNFVHVKDVAGAFVRSAERLVEQREREETGMEKYEVASDEDPGVMDVAELVQAVAREERDIDVEVQLVENPRRGETLVDEFGVETTRAREQLRWEPGQSVEVAIREQLTDS